MNKKIAILGAGNIGASIAGGLMNSGEYAPKDIILTRRTIDLLKPFEDKGCVVEPDNCSAVKMSEVILLCVEPSRLDVLLEEIQPVVHKSVHIIISIVSGVSIDQIKEKLGQAVMVIRAMPNTAIGISASMTCLSFRKKDHQALDISLALFNKLGETIIINEDLMGAATALGACGVAFFLRAVRAASQGGIEIGFSSEDAIKIAAQAAKGAASLLLESKNHPEFEIDKVTTPQGCTISGLNSMENAGFSAAFIQGITKSANKAEMLYKNQ